MASEDSKVQRIFRSSWDVRVVLRFLDRAFVSPRLSAEKRCLNQSSTSHLLSSRRPEALGVTQCALDEKSDGILPSALSRWCLLCILSRREAVLRSRRNSRRKLVLKDFCLERWSCWVFRKVLCKRSQEH
ncbi:hypothetical protein WJX84_002203 [Apatococcus fuscideae]|uniref:Uncharacterized protein n=1 Tax=Apatococcus fuscideae TaxID=2026836 RepID=A0AAW1T769_9CHLO